MTDSVPESMPKREPSAQKRQAAAEVAEMFVAFRDEGFTEPQALDLIGSWMKAIFGGTAQSGGPE